MLVKDTLVKIRCSEYRPGTVGHVVSGPDQRGYYKVMLTEQCCSFIDKFLESELEIKLK